MSSRWLMFSLLLLLGRSLWAVVRAEDPATGLEHWKKTVRTRFPEVRQLSVAELAAWLADTNRVPPQLLDVRTAPEFAVSHLPGARQVDPRSPAPDLLRSLDRTRPVVVYCSVGWRSSDLATRLQQSGCTNVLNLEGSAFAWASEGRTLVSSNGATRRVHPYNETFGRLLRPENQAAVPPAP
ncbi:MAG: rhodanese-like domain-containing protein [Verrucomicrobiota bacterium]